MCMQIQNQWNTGVAVSPHWAANEMNAKYYMEVILQVLKLGLFEPDTIIFTSAV